MLTIDSQKGTALSLQQIADLVKGKILGDPHYLIEGVNTLSEATEREVSFFYHPPYQKSSYSSSLKQSRAGAILIESSVLAEKSEYCQNFILVDKASVAFDLTCAHFLAVHDRKSGFSSIHPTAVVHADSVLGEGVHLAPHVVIDRGCFIGAKTTIGAGSYVGPNVSIGENCLIHPRVVLEEGTALADRVTLQSGAVIGSCGFGYDVGKEGKHTKITQWGRVVIEEDVEIGANTTIDRSRLKETRIRRGTKIDNLVQIAHGVQIGEENLLASQVGVAGSSKTGRGVVLGGQAGIVGHCVLDDGVVVAAKTGVSKSLSKGFYASAFPAIPIQEYHTLYACYKRLKKTTSFRKEF